MTKCENEVSCDHRSIRQQHEVQLEQVDGSIEEIANYNHQCYICDKTFSANSNLNRHLRKIHHETVLSPYNNMRCALCESQYPSSSLYIKHLERDHQVSIQVENLKFNSRKAFEEWKDEIESKTTSQFIKSRGQKQTKDIKKTYYSCNRSGYFVSKAKTQKHLKRQGSRKINGRCPASMNVTVNLDSSYDVRFIKTHVGHDFELIHLDLSEKDRNLIVEKLESGITKRDVIRQIRTDTNQKSTFIAATNTSTTATGGSTTSSLLSGLDGVQPIVLSTRSSMPGHGEQEIEVVIPAISDIVTFTGPKSEATIDRSELTERGQTKCDKETPAQNQVLPSSVVSRLHLATSKDIHNILNSKHLDSKKIRHNYDLNTIEHWIREMKELGEESTTVLFYKDQGEASPRFPKINNHDFLFVIMMDGQAIALKRLASRCIVLDSTHAVRCEHLHLTYMSVIDEIGKNFPVAFMFSTRTDLDTLEVFYELIRDKVGQVATRTLIADDLHDFYQAWWKIMSMPLHNLPAPWSVFDSWIRKLNLINNKEKSRKIKKQLKLLLNETETEKFNKSLKNIISEHKRDPDTHEFVQYFEGQFAKNPDVWSNCLRKTIGVSNQQLWLMHDKFKSVYKEGKNSKKMCKYITCLMELFEEHQLKELLKVETSNVDRRHKSIMSRHEKGVAIGLSVYEVAVDPTYWLCPSEWTDVHDEIRQTSDPNTLNNQPRRCCELVCPECKICRHRYKCTCLDYVVNLNMCKHIHKITSLCKQA